MSAVSPLCSFSEYHFFKLHVCRHLVFDKLAQLFANLKKLWAEDRVFFPTSAHQMISGKNNNKQLPLIILWQLAFCLHLSFSVERL